MHNGMILVDLHKVFDTLDHEVPLEKMTCICFQTFLLNFSIPISQTETFWFLLIMLFLR